MVGSNNSVKRFKIRKLKRITMRNQLIVMKFHSCLEIINKRVSIVINQCSADNAENKLNMNIILIITFQLFY